MLGKYNKNVSQVAPTLLKQALMDDIQQRIVSPQLHRMTEEQLQIVQTS